MKHSNRSLQNMKHTEKKEFKENKECQRVVGQLQVAWHTGKRTCWRTAGRTRGEYLKQCGQKVPKVDENHKNTDPRSSMIPKHRDMKKTISRHITNCSKSRIKSLKAARRKNKNHSTNRGMKVRMTSHFSWKQWKQKDSRGTHLKYRRRKPSKAPLK